MRCHRTGQTIYAMDNPIKVKIDGEEVFFSKAGFKCALQPPHLQLSRVFVLSWPAHGASSNTFPFRTHTPSSRVRRMPLAVSHSMAVASYVAVGCMGMRVHIPV